MAETSPLARVLEVDDDPSLLRLLRRCLQDAGHDVVAVTSLSEAEVVLNRTPVDVCVLDLCLGDQSGLDLLPRLQEVAPWVRVIVVTASNDVSTAIGAVRAGAADFLAKPCSPDELLLSVGQQMEAIQMQRRIDQLEAAQNEQGGYSTESECPAYRAMLDMARRVAETDATVLILGENGTGKTQLAHMIHRWSRRSKAVFATVSCPSLSAELLASELFGHVRGAFTGATDNRPGRVQIAEGGTLFLDEIGDMPSALQPKMLRFLQDREYERVGDPHTRKADVRVVAATNQDMEAMIREGRFREDLYYRLNVVTLTVPPLRERRDDIRALAEWHLAKLARNYDRPARRFSRAAMSVLMMHAWPGNLRELHNVIERAVIIGDGEVIGPELLPFAATRPPPSLGLRAGDAVSLEELERAHIEAVIAVSPSLEAAAALLEIDSSTLYRKRKLYSDAA